MDGKRFTDELLYQSTMSVAKGMLKSGAINETDYKKIEDHFLKKYRPALGTLMAENELT